MHILTEGSTIGGLGFETDGGMKRDEGSQFDTRADDRRRT